MDIKMIQFDLAKMRVNVNFWVDKIHFPIMTRPFPKRPKIYKPGQKLNEKLSIF